MTLSHTWDLSPAEARRLQEELRGQIVQKNLITSPIARVAGIDIGFERKGTVTRAAAVVLSYPGLEAVDKAIARRPTCFPYVPGLLSFRECPAALAALDGLTASAEVLVCDGQGYAHPRRFGLACHLGLLTATPSIGVAKSRLIGVHDQVPDRKGAWVPLRDGGETIGAVLRTRKGVKPVFVSVGYGFTLAAAVDLVLGLTPRYRLPETTRQAHRLASG
ncbi:MAG: deoxyribonuclease V [Rhodospirillaceae bacterium]|nr:deoxyribonuclease V [Rhodospirillaceae bacterium]